MSPHLLLSEAPPIPAHAIMALLALVLGVFQLLTPKGTIVHRGLGYLWVAAMAGVAVTAAFISELQMWGRFSPIHLLVPYVLLSLWLGVRAARRGDIKTHKRTMLSLMFFALVLAGAFTLVPDRVMHDVVFGG